MNVLVATICRAAPIGGVHGQLLQWRSASNTWEILYEISDQYNDLNPRGGDRGLRGIAYDQKSAIYLITTARRILVFDIMFRQTGEISHPGFQHLHEIEIIGRVAYVLSTGNDRIFAVDLNKMAVTFSLYLRWDQSRLQLGSVREEPAANPIIQYNRLHLNAIQVFSNRNILLVSGAKSRSIIAVSENNLRCFAPLPFGSHNFHYDFGNLYYLNTDQDAIGIRRSHMSETFLHASLHRASISGAKISSMIARPNFLRGMERVGIDGSFIFGLSPTSIGHFNPKRRKISLLSTYTKNVHWMVGSLRIMGTRGID